MSMPPWIQARVVFLKQPFLAHGCPQHDHSVQKRKQLSGLCNLMFILRWHELKLQAALKVDIKYTQFLIVEEKKKANRQYDHFKLPPTGFHSSLPLSPISLSSLSSVLWWATGWRSCIRTGRGGTGGAVSGRPFGLPSVRQWGRTDASRNLCRLQSREQNWLGSPRY